MDRGHKAAERPAQPLWVALAVALSFGMLLKLDPFGLELAAERRSEAVAMRVTAPFYHASGRVAVVLIDDAYLSAYNTGWPLTYAREGQLLRQILSHEPSAVFVDILHSHPHAGGLERPDAARPGEQIAVDPVANLLRALPDPPPLTVSPGPATSEAAVVTPDAAAAPVSPPIPVYLPMNTRPGDRGDGGDCAEDERNAPSTPVFDAQSLVPELRQAVLVPPGVAAADVRGAAGPATGAPAEAVGHFSPVLVRWQGCGRRYPLYLRGNTHARTPAFAMYADACGIDGPLATTRADADRAALHCPVLPPGYPGADDRHPADYARIVAQYAQPMVVRDGAHLPERLEDYLVELSPGQTVCQSYRRAEGAPAGPWAALADWARSMPLALSQLAHSVLGDLRDDEDRNLALPCTAIPVLAASQVQAHGADLKDFLQGRYVFVGTRLEGLQDRIESPVHGLVPGVVWNAMALDNLFVHGAWYMHPREGVWSYTLAIVLLLGYACYTWWLSKWPASERLTLVLSALSLAIWLVLAIVSGHPWLCAAAALGLELLRPRATAQHCALFLVLLLFAALLVNFGVAPGNWVGLYMTMVGFAEVSAHLLRRHEAHIPNPASVSGHLWARFRRPPGAPATRHGNRSSTHKH